MRVSSEVDEREGGVGGGGGGEAEVAAKWSREEAGSVASGLD
jgi:hypothetical protein